MTLDTKNTLSLTDIHQLVKSDFEQVDALMQTSLHSDVSLIQTISAYIIHSGGKRLRPLLTLLAARALDCNNAHHITLAVIVEFLHTATLLHDDVVDASSLRRGRKTVNEVWGNAPSVLVGDFLYSRAFQLMTSLQNIKIYDLLANATNIIAQGEVLQLIRRNQIETSQTHYLEVIRYKTATLFSTAAECGVVVAGQAHDARTQAAFALYGMHLGTAFQMVDDWLDYSVSSQETGKNPGDDLAEGKVTLPIIYVIQTGTAQQKHTVQKALQTGDTKHLAEVLDILREIEAEKYVIDLAQKEANLAKAALHDLIPESPYKKALSALADFAVQRKN